MFTIYQIKVSEEVHNYVNSNDRGHTGAAERYPLYEAKLQTQHHGSDGFEPHMFQHFTNVATVHTTGDLQRADGTSYRVEDLEEVFKILNGYYYDEDSETDPVFDAHVSGYKMKTVTRKSGETITYRDMHSLSVGDIVHNSATDTYHIVDGFGFGEVSVDTTHSEVA